MPTRALALAALLVAAAPAVMAQDAPANPAEIAAAMDVLKKFQTDAATADKNLANFDVLDFDVYSNQQWDRLKESHAENIVVHYPDGTTTTGIPDHVEKLKPLFAWAPDTKIVEHPIRIGNGEWTAVTGQLTGTFTEPMPIGDGKTIPPTGKKFVITMATIAHWTEAGVIDEEHLFWDNQAFMTQIGLAQ